MWFPNTISFSDSLDAEISLKIIDSRGRSVDRKAEAETKTDEVRMRKNHTPS